MNTLERESPKVKEGGLDFHNTGSRRDEGSLPLQMGSVIIAHLTEKNVPQPELHGLT